jgi:hypothetical protein
MAASALMSVPLMTMPFGSDAVTAGARPCMHASSVVACHTTQAWQLSEDRHVFLLRSLSVCTCLSAYLSVFLSWFRSLCLSVSLSLSLSVFLAVRPTLDLSLCAYCALPIDACRATVLRAHIGAGPCKIRSWRGPCANVLMLKLFTCEQRLKSVLTMHPVHLTRLRMRVCCATCHAGRYRGHACSLYCASQRRGSQEQCANQDVCQYQQCR